MQRRREKANRMTHDFTWQQFLLAALLLTAVWEAVIILLFFRKDLLGLFRRKRKVRPPARRWIPEPVEKPEEIQPADVMGAPAEEEGVITSSMEEIRFAGGVEDQATRLGLISDALEELKGIFRLLREKGGTKHDFFSMIGMLKAKYPAIKNSKNLAAINSLIRRELPFELTEEEFTRLWD